MPKHLQQKTTTNDISKILQYTIYILYMLHIIITSKTTTTNYAQNYHFQAALSFAFFGALTPNASSCPAIDLEQFLSSLLS